MISMIIRLKDDPSSGKKYTKPKCYFGANIGECTLVDCGKTRCMSSDDYIRLPIANVEETLPNNDLWLDNNAPTLLSSKYHPELDVSPEL